MGNLRDGGVHWVNGWRGEDIRPREAEAKAWGGMEDYGLRV